MSTLIVFSKRIWFGLIHGKGLFGKIRTIYIFCTISLAKTPQSISIHGITHPIFVETGSDIAMLIEMFGDQEYLLPKAAIVDTVIDIGANVGFSALYFHTKYPKASIVAVEPDPKNIEKLKLNTESEALIKIIEGAADATSGTRTFYSDQHVGMSSSFNKRFESQKEITVRTYSFEDIFHLSGFSQVDLLKFDIEGAEWNLFSKQKIPQARYIIGEYHEDIVGKPIQEFLKFFPNYQYRIRPSAKGRYIIFLSRN